MERYVFDTWEVKKLKGKGNFGAVYEIEKDGEKEALKVVDIIAQNSDFNEILGLDNSTELEEKTEQVMKEIDMLYYLKGNTHIVNYIDHYVNKKEAVYSLYLKMEYLYGLDEYYGEDIESNKALSITYDILDALIVCENNAIVHGDIKPQNIMVDKQGNNKLTDFGISKIMSTQKVNTYTAAYAAPEIITHREYTKQSDLYSLALVIYQIYNNNLLPFMKKGFRKKDTSKIIHNRLNRDIPAPANGSKKLNEFFFKALNRNPKERFQSAYEMKECLYHLQKNNLLPKVFVAMPILLAVAIKFNSYTTLGVEVTKHTMIDMLFSMSITSKVIVGVSSSLVVGGGTYMTVNTIQNVFHQQDSNNKEGQILPIDKTKSQELYYDLDAKETYEKLVDKMNKEISFFKVDTNRESPVWYRDDIYKLENNIGLIQRHKIEVGKIEQYECTIQTLDNTYTISSLDKQENSLYSECPTGNTYLNTMVDNYFKSSYYTVKDIFKNETNGKISIVLYLIRTGTISEYLCHEIVLNDDGFIEKTIENSMDDDFTQVIEGTQIISLYSSYNEKKEADFYQMVDLLRSLDGISQNEVIQKTGFEK